MDRKFVRVNADAASLGAMARRLKRIEADLAFVACDLAHGSITKSGIDQMVDLGLKVRAIREQIEASEEADVAGVRGPGGVVVNFRRS